MDWSDIGRFGTLSLLRSLPVESVATSYPIDDEELTIGRDQSCSLRLYYPAVSALHAKITFVERKAFLVVLGTNGLLLDDAPLFPAVQSAPGPTTVPLQNNSVLEIHKKRFRFTYPPKHLRPALINTPSRATPVPNRRPLRLSMIASAHVFTPGPSPDPQENLRVLQTPLRTPFAREEEEIVLVQSDAPRILEEGKDLVILDEVEPEPAPILPFPLPMTPQAPQTPVRRRPRPSLHRAVLIRSAQRAAIQREMQMEEEQDADEVEETIDAIAEAEEVDEDIQEVPPPDNQKPSTGWRKSIDMVKGSLGWAFRGLSVEPKEEEEEPDLVQDDGEEDHDEYQEYDEKLDDDAYEHDEQDMVEHYNEDAYEDEQQHEESHEEQEEPPRPLGRFMTPQLPRTMSVREARMSLGGAADTGPRRVRVVAPWKVGEIQVPNAVKEEEGGSTAAPPSTPRSPVKREKLTEEEREAIRARRRSAVATPDSFFKGQTPGSRRTLFPSLAPLPSPSFNQPDEPASAVSQAPNTTIKEESSTASASTTVKSDDDEKEDTAVLLARMKQMVEGVKQRQSLGRQSLNLSPRKREGGFSLLAPGHAMAHAPSRILIEEDENESEETYGDVELLEHNPSNGQSSHDHTAQAPPQTPKMSDLRHVFGRPHDQPSTPALAGVRDMFRAAQPQLLPATPQMEGLRDMLATPAAYRRTSPERRAPPQEPTAQANEDETTHDVQEDEEAANPIESLPARGARGRKAPGASRIARRATVPVPQSAPARGTRAASHALEDEQDSADAPGEGARPVRRTRARTADGAVGQTRSTRGKATEKKPATPEPLEDEGEPAAHATRATRHRQPTDSSTSSHTDDAADTKPARKTRAKTPTTAAKAGPTRRGTRAKPIEVPEDDEDDPLDTLPRAGTPAHEEEAPPAPAPAPAAPRARRGTRSKIPVGAVKQEDAELALPAEQPAEPAARTTRARRTPVPRGTTPSGMAGRAGTRSRGAAASAAAGTSLAAASASGEAAIPEDKENTPEAGEESEQEEAKPAGARARAAAGVLDISCGSCGPEVNGCITRSAMRRCPALSRLPKNPNGVKSVNFRRTTPGSLTRIHYVQRPPLPSQVLDPTHPALTYTAHDFARAFPWRTYPGFKLRVVPKGLLQPPATPYPSPPYLLNHGRMKSSRSVNMSLLDTAPKAVGGRVVRQEVLRKFKTAISLIVVRGAHVEGEEGEEKLVFMEDEAAAGVGLVLTDWTYIIHPELSVYSMPYERLIRSLREALEVSAAAGRRLERQWDLLKAFFQGKKPSKRHKPAQISSEKAGIPKHAQKSFIRTLQDLSSVPPPLHDESGRGSEEATGQREDGPLHTDSGEPETPAVPPGSLNALLSRHSKRRPAVRDVATELPMAVLNCNSRLTPMPQIPSIRGKLKPSTPQAPRRGS
ncbi:hypothetical protein BD413DRAFT_473526 [Trametes elegans]|nr:hypothetical protein BD413DRAFT_473526 [Trametes elegans]